MYTTNFSDTTDGYSKTYNSRIGDLLTISSLTPYTTYKYIISASTSAGSGQATDSAYVTTSETAKDMSHSDLQPQICVVLTLTYKGTP